MGKWLTVFKLILLPLVRAQAACSTISSSLDRQTRAREDSRVTDNSLSICYRCARNGSKRALFTLQQKPDMPWKLTRASLVHYDIFGAPARPIVYRFPILISFSRFAHISSLSTRLRHRRRERFQFPLSTQACQAREDSPWYQCNSNRYSPFLSILAYLTCAYRWHYSLCDLFFFANDSKFTQSSLQLILSVCKTLNADDFHGQDRHRLFN